MNTIAKSNNYGKFLVLWIGELLTSIGSGISSFGLAVYVFELTGRATDVSLVAVCAFFPSIVLSPFGGVLADRIDRRILMIIGDAFSALGLLMMYLIIAFGNIAVWQICVCVAISSAFTALLDPAYRATITDLLSEEQFSKASGLIQLAGSAKFLLAPAIAGILLSVTDIKTLLLIDICTVFYAAGAAFFIKRILGKFKWKASEDNLFADFVEGWKCITANKGLLYLIVLLSLITLFIGLLQTLYTPMVLAFSDAQTLGLIEAIGATGMLISSIVLGIISIKKKYIRIIVLSLCMTGLCTALIGTTINPIVLTAFTFLFFLTIPPTQTCIDVLMRKSTPNELQGRVWGLASFISNMGYILSYGLSGVLADNIFNPLLLEGGALASSVGSIIGTGPGRGIAFQFILSGILMVMVAIFLSRIKSIRDLEKSSALSIDSDTAIAT